METDTNSCRSEIVPVSCKYPLTKRNDVNLSVNVFSTKVVIGDTIFTSLARSSEPRKGLAACRAKAVPSFLSYFKNLKIGPTPGTEPATSRYVTTRF